MSESGLHFIMDQCSFLIVPWLCVSLSVRVGWWQGGVSWRQLGLGVLSVLRSHTLLFTDSLSILFSRLASARRGSLAALPRSSSFSLLSLRPLGGVRWSLCCVSCGLRVSRPLHV